MSTGLPTDKKRAPSLLARFEELLLCILLTAMILLACTQIVMRSLFSSGLDWADPLLRYMVLWSGFLGAAMATSKSRHIALDLLGFIVPKRFQPWMNFLIHLFSSVVAGFLTYASYLFIRNEMEYGGISLLAMPSWVWNLIFPLAFCLITLRFFLISIGNLKKAITPPTPLQKQ